MHPMPDSNCRSLTLESPRPTNQSLVGRYPNRFGRLVFVLSIATFPSVQALKRPWPKTAILISVDRRDHELVDSEEGGESQDAVNVACRSEGLG